MKFLASFLFFVLMAIVVAEAYVPPVQQPHPNAPKLPVFIGHGPFNPRHRRSPKGGSISVDAKKEGGKTSWNIEGKKNIYENKHGSVWVSGSANKPPGGKSQSSVGVGGSFSFGK